MRPKDRSAEAENLRKAIRTRNDFSEQRAAAEEVGDRIRAKKLTGDIELAQHEANEAADTYRKSRK